MPRPPSLVTDFRARVASFVTAFQEHPRGWMHGLAALIGAGALTLGACGLGVYTQHVAAFQSPDKVIEEQSSGGAQIYDRNGKLLYEYVDDRSGLRSPVKLEDISPWMIAATISTEDSSFWSNPGVNTRGIVRAGLEALHLREADAGATTGGSSITQQLVKNIYIAQNERLKRSYTRKAKETIFALELSNRYSKNQILEWYLNQISYGGLYNGVEAASLGYFGKNAKDLTLPEAALLAGIPASPARYDPTNNPDDAVARRNEVLNLMRTRGRTQVTGPDGSTEQAATIQINDDGTKVNITDGELFVSTAAPISLNRQHYQVRAPHWVFGVIEPSLIKRFGKDALYRGGLRVTTSLDIDMQEKAQATLERWISEFEESSGGHNGAMVAMDPKTSEVLVYIGSRDYFNKDLQGNVDNASPANGRSPGSTLKPFTYTAAFEDLGWGPNTEVLDTPITFDDGGKPFTPSNPAKDFRGPTAIHVALGNSLNIPAFKTALYVGVPKVVDEYKKFGITGLDGNSYGPSVTLGGVDVKLSDVTYAYSVLAAGGVMRGVPTEQDLPSGNRTLDPLTILQVTRADGSFLYPNTRDHQVKVQEKTVVAPQYAYMINKILSDPNNFCLTYGCGALSIGRTWAVKTGTSEPFENSTNIGETWTYGYTPELVTGVWFGNADNAPLHNITSTSVSYRAVRDFMVEALAKTPASEFTDPGGLVQAAVCEPSMLKATPACGRVIQNQLPAEKAPQQADNWWQSVTIDRRDGRAATDSTPGEFRQELRAMVIPDSVKGFARTQAEEWARILNVSTSALPKPGEPLPATPEANGATVRIDAPRSGDRVSGNVSITGVADSDAFVRYRLDVAGPGGSRTIRESTTAQRGGTLGVWNTAGLSPGAYTITLVVEDSKRGEVKSSVTVEVVSGGGGTTPTAVSTPTGRAATPTRPAATTEPATETPVPPPVATQTPPPAPVATPTP